MIYRISGRTDGAHGISGIWVGVGTANMELLHYMLSNSRLNSERVST